MPVTVLAGRSVASPSNAPFRKFATPEPVGGHAAPSIVFVTPAITVLRTVAFDELMRIAVNTLQYSFVFERPVSAIVQLRITAESPISER